MSASATGLPTARRISPGEFFAQCGIVLVLMVLVVSKTILSPVLREGQQLFLTPRNLIQVLFQAAINAIIAVGKVYDVGSSNVHWADIWRGLKAIKFDGFLVLESFAAVNPDIQAATCLWRPPNQPSEVLGRGGLEFLREGAQAPGLL